MTVKKSKCFRHRHEIVCLPHSYPAHIPTLHTLLPCFRQCKQVSDIPDAPDNPYKRTIYIITVIPRIAAHPST